MGMTVAGVQPEQMTEGRTYAVTVHRKRGSEVTYVGRFGGRGPDPYGLSKDAIKVGQDSGVPVFIDIDLVSCIEEEVA